MSQQDKDRNNQNDCLDFPRRHMSETSVGQETKALYAAMPLRRVIRRKSGTPRFVLECGHPIRSEVILLEDDQVRCLECYKRQMAQAGRMLE